MKKLFIALFFASASVTGMAQNADITEKYSVATNSFWSNWFIQGGVTWEAWYGNYEDGMGFSKNPFKAFRSDSAQSSKECGVSQYGTTRTSILTTSIGFCARMFCSI